MFGGMGGGRSSLRFFRLGAFVLILVLGAAFHHSGSTYHAIYYVYLVVIIGAVVASLALRGRSRGSGWGGRGTFDGGRGSTGGRDSDAGSGSFGTGPPPRPAPLDNPDPEAGEPPAP
jgi:hypothetical protein